ncbi:MAG: 6-phosphofructokinase [Actinomycetota bacterium]|nr:6-phosphofructokinase [Actinomycetota bacterium]
MRLGVLTGGGDCPGLNAVLRAIVRTGTRRDVSFVGFHDGWLGVLDDETTELDLVTTRGILHRGGTIIGSSGTNPMRRDGGPEAVEAAIDRHGLDGLIVVGGEGTLGAASALSDRGVPIVGVPKTIDNDIPATDVTVGFHTAVQVATDAIDRLHTTAESHDRVMVIEVMGRNAGWIALYAAMTGGADMLLIPEEPFDIEEACSHLRHRHMNASSFSIVVVAEGAEPVEGTMAAPEYPLDENGFPRLGGISNVIAPEIEKRTGYGTRVTILGHVQRGGSPVAFDRLLGTRFGIAALELAAAGGWGRMVSRQGQDITDVPLVEATGPRKVVPSELYREAAIFFG